MAPKFSTPRKVITATATVDTSFVSEWDVRRALEQTARDNGVTVSGLTVTIADGERTVTMTESEYDALVTGASGEQSSAE
jgi:hypothetical protein